MSADAQGDVEGPLLQLRSGHRTGRHVHDLDTHLRDPGCSLESRSKGLGGRTDQPDDRGLCRLPDEGRDDDQGHDKQRRERRENPDQATAQPLSDLALRDQAHGR
jgi:hypothetical protein